ncbi:hypothetical protein [Candidatus Poriferisocius sp.]|uniref:hypothetical protein n=1 Tax=Candidatus Poriferisocius sp. TaxID=3101276 RepID=UPI003B5CBD69
MAYYTAFDLDEGYLTFANGNEPETGHEVRNVGIMVWAHALHLELFLSDLLKQVQSYATRIPADASPNLPKFAA